MEQSQTMEKLGKIEWRAHNVLPQKLRTKDKAGLEECANRDFEMAGKCGNIEAAEMARLTNPYARMCGPIVERMMSEERYRVQQV